MEAHRGGLEIETKEVCVSEVLIQKEKFYYSVKLNRPEKRNAFTPSMVEELAKCFETVGEDKYARAVLLTGAGGSFCSGADLDWMKSMIQFNKAENKNDAKALFRMYAAAARCPLPIICYVQGHVFGGGLGLAAVSDIVVAEINTKFCFSEVKLGIVPAVISPFVFRKMAMNKAREFMLTGRIFGAEAALSAGLIEHCARELEAREYLQETLDLIAHAGPEALRDAKMLFEKVREVSLGDAEDMTTEVIANSRVGAEGQEGLKSFFDKRKPGWIWSAPDGD